MIRKKDLKENIEQLKNETNNLYEKIRNIEKNQKIEIGEGRTPNGISLGGPIYTKITMKEILLEILKYLDLDIVEIKNLKSFELKPIKQKKGK